MVGLHDPVNAATLRFLVVEDHDFQRSAVLNMLSRLGATDLLEAADGQAALSLLRNAHPPVDIVISDLDMPGMDGIEFIRTVGASGFPVAIAALSAVDGSVLAAVESMAAAYRIPLLGVLTKPLTPAALHAVVARYRPASQAGQCQASSSLAFSTENIRQGLIRGEFEPYFQPKVTLASGSLCGFEALARWRHPDAGIVAPQAFLPAMEAHGWIDDLTWVMLQKSAAWCRRWRASGADVSVSVNLSVNSVRDVRMAERVTAIVTTEGLEPRNVILELTESAAAGDRLGEVLENLVRLRLKGFGLAIDDFGTGYSSVQQLSRVAFTELKIDRSFVTDAPNRESAMILLQSSMEMARRLKLTCVAEGVETAAQWDLLRALGCELAQGYFISPPMDGRSVAAWINGRGVHRASHEKT